jgi:hypothetical protein
VPRETARRHCHESVEQAQQTGKARHRNQCRQQPGHATCRSTGQQPAQKFGRFAQHATYEGRGEEGREQREQEAAAYITLFALFAVGAFHVIRKTDDPFIRIASGGITIWIVGQALINIGVVLRIFPVLGVPLPFMSQGGTALLSVLMACGVLLSFARTLPTSAPTARAGSRGATTVARRGKVSA